MGSDAKRLGDLVRDRRTVQRCGLRLDSGARCPGYLKSLPRKQAIAVCEVCGKPQLQLARIFEQREKKTVRRDELRRSAFFMQWRSSPADAGEFLRSAFGPRCDTEEGLDEVRTTLGCWSKSDRSKLTMALAALAAREAAKDSGG